MWGLLMLKRLRSKWICDIWMVKASRWTDVWRSLNHVRMIKCVLLLIGGNEHHICTLQNMWKIVMMLCCCSCWYCLVKLRPSISYYMLMHTLTESSLTACLVYLWVSSTSPTTKDSISLYKNLVFFIASSRSIITSPAKNLIIALLLICLL